MESSSTACGLSCILPSTQQRLSRCAFPLSALESLALGPEDVCERISARGLVGVSELPTSALGPGDTCVWECISARGLVGVVCSCGGVFWLPIGWSERVLSKTINSRAPKNRRNRKRYFKKQMFNFQNFPLLESNQSFLNTHTTKRTNF